MKIKEIPVSESTCATADPDTHFLFSDSLYTTATSRGKTSMALDGKCLFSWNASEYIISVLPSAEGLWTLGNDRDGDGFALRLDGELKFSSLSGTASPMYRDQGQLCFSYRVMLGDYSAVYLVRDCSDIPVSPRYGGSVMDAAVCGGVLHMVENLDGFFRVWTAGTSEDHYPFPGFGSAGARLYRRGESGCAAVISLVGGATGMPLDMILEDGEEQLRGGGSASYHYYSEEDCAHVVLDRYGEKLSVMWNGEDVDIPGVMLQNERCAAIYDGQLYMALSSVEGERTYLLGGGRKTELKFSGALTAIDLSPPS